MTYHARTPCRHALGRGTCAGLTAATLLWAPIAGASELADLVERVSPSVVTVLATQDAQTVAGREFAPGANPFPPGSPFGEFFKRFGPPKGAPDPEGDAPARALGSGFVVEGDGYIVTNNHVVKDASKVRVRMSDEREFDATVVGADEQTDLALLKIAAKDLPLLALGDSDAMRVGDDVVAVGNPFGLGGTVTRGIISAKGRDIQAGPYVDFIQTDAAINHGNSGGPLFNLDGEVIGVNAAIYSPSGGSVGVGFAIPSNTVKLVVADLKADGKVDRGWLGVSIQNVTREIGAALGMDEPHGALVAQVMDGAPAQGVLAEGDVILSFNGHAVETSHDLPRLVAAVQADRTVAVEILRGGSKKSLEVKIGTLANAKQAAADNIAPASGVASERLGATFTALTPETRDRLGLASDSAGALVSDLKADGPAAEAGLRVGDLIEKVGDRSVASPGDLDAAVKDTETSAALLLVQRQGARVFVGVSLKA
ncbi:MAG: Do family serine endopeptidase [Paracoccaceae bacterium]